MSKFRRNEVDVVDAIQVTFEITREELRAFDTRVMVGPDWDAFDRWIMLPSGERAFCYGDWIVKSERGDLWFSSPDTFATDYTDYTDISPYLAQLDAWAKVFALATETPFDFCKDVYLGGGADFRDTDFRNSANTHGVDAV